MTRHRYACPLRWGDMDQLGHVNNVTYVDYLQEARLDLLRGAPGLVHGVVVVRHEVQYLSPLVFRPEPVSVDVWLTEVRAGSFTMASEVYDETPTGRRVYLRGRSVLAPYDFEGGHPRRLTGPERELLERYLEPGEPLASTVDVVEAPAERRHRYDCTVRFSDVDAYGHANNVQYFEFFQEARIALMAGIGQQIEGGAGDALSVVVAQLDVDYRRPVFYRPAPYAADTWISAVGRSSFTIDGELRDGGALASRCRAVLVCFDAETQRSRPLTERQASLLSMNSAAYVT